MSHPSRRALLRLMLAAGFTGTASRALAQYPAKPIRFFQGFTPGSLVDLSARQAGAEMSKRLGQQILVETRPGANGAVAYAAVAASEPDGYSFLWGGISNHPIFMKNGSDMTKELVPVAGMVSTPLFMFVRSNLPIKSLADLKSWVKANPGKLNFGASAVTNELIMQVVKARGDIPYTSIPYKGAAAVVQPLLTNEVDLTISSAPAFLPHVEKGAVRPLFTTAAKRSSLFSEVPTAAEFGIPGLVVLSETGIWAPKGTPRDVVTKVSDAAQTVARMPIIATQFRAYGAEPVGSGPEALMRSTEEIIAFWREAARMAKYQPE